jgi:hypothetical protein
MRFFGLWQGLFERGVHYRGHLFHKFQLWEEGTLVLCGLWKPSVEPRREDCLEILFLDHWPHSCHHGFFANVEVGAALRKHTTTSPVLCNVTRCYSTKTIFDRHFLLLKPVALVVPADIQLSPSENRLAKQLQVILVYLDVLVVTFQDEGLQMCDSVITWVRQWRHYPS